MSRRRKTGIPRTKIVALLALALVVGTLLRWAESRQTRNEPIPDTIYGFQTSVLEHLSHKSIQIGIPATSEDLSDILNPRYCGCPCGRKLMDCFGCSVAKADLSLARTALREGRTPLEIQRHLNAPLVLVEWGDFGSKATRERAQDVIRLRKEYGTLLKVFYRHIPSDEKWIAKKVAIASECAREQGRFWEMYGYLMDNQDIPSDQTMIATAKKAGCDADTFQSCLETKEFLAQLSKDVEAGSRFGIVEVPAFFLNGTKLDRVESYQDLKSAMEAKLNKLAL